MAWLTTYTDANKVVDSVATAFETFTWYERDDSQDPPVLIPHDQAAPVTVINFRYVGMDYNSALSCRTAMEAIASTTFVEVVRENEGGAYSVRVTQQEAYVAP